MNDRKQTKINLKIRNTDLTRSATIDPKMMMIDPKMMMIDPNMIMIDPNMMMIDHKKMMIDPKKMTIDTKMKLLQETNLKITGPTRIFGEN